MHKKSLDARCFDDAVCLDAETIYGFNNLIYMSRKFNEKLYRDKKSLLKKLNIDPNKENLLRKVTVLNSEELKRIDLARRYVAINGGTSIEQTQSVTIGQTQTIATTTTLGFEVELSAVVGAALEVLISEVIILAPHAGYWDTFATIYPLSAREIGKKVEWLIDSTEN